MLHTFFRKLAPVAAIAMGLAVTGCDNMNVSFDGPEGVPLAELDTIDASPSELVLAGPDTVRLTEGKTLTISVEGESEAVDVVRFDLDGDKLTVTREKNSNVNGVAIVNVTMPAPQQISLLGSGTVEVQSMASDASINILGSGKIATGKITAKSLDVNIGGSGELSSSGTADSLDLKIGGSGSADLAALQVGKATVNIGGSGSANFASDGNVEANILGSGDVTVRGNAKCTINAMGSGTLNCEGGVTEGSEKPQATEAPGAPEAPAT